MDVHYKRLSLMMNHTVCCIVLCNHIYNAGYLSCIVYERTPKCHFGATYWWALITKDNNDVRKSLFLMSVFQARELLVFMYRLMEHFQMNLSQRFEWIGCFPPGWSLVRPALKMLVFVCNMCGNVNRIFFKC